MSIKREDCFIWTPADCMRELGLKKSIVFSRLKEAGLTGQGGEYTTQQVLSAFFPDIKQKRAELIELQRQEQQMRVRMMRGELLNAEQLRQGLEAVFIAIRQIVQRSSLPEVDQIDILENISEMHLETVLAEGARRTQRLIRFQQPEQPELKQPEEDNEDEDNAEN
jgi:phage terminase Nu1 subunit (DNA packaging protein)